MRRLQSMTPLAADWCCILRLSKPGFDSYASEFFIHFSWNHQTWLAFFQWRVPTQHINKSWQRNRSFL